MKKHKTVFLSFVVAAAVSLWLPPQSAAKSNSHAGHHQNTQHHPVASHPAHQGGHHGDSAPAQPGMAGTAHNPGGGGQPVTQHHGTDGPTVGVHNSPSHPAQTGPGTGLGEVPKPPVIVSPKPVIGQKVPKPIVQQVPKPIVQQVPKPIVQQVPTPIVQQVPTPIVQQVPKPIVQQVPKPIVQQVPKPIVQQVPKPIVQQVPTPIVQPPVIVSPNPEIGQKVPQLVQHRPLPHKGPGTKPGRSLPPARKLPGVASPHHVGHAQIFQHAHATEGHSPGPGKDGRASTAAETAGRVVFLPPQVMHGVITPGVPVQGASAGRRAGIRLFCLLPTRRPDGLSFGGLLAPPPGWRPAQKATSTHVALQGGANYIDPVLRALPVNHPPHAVCLCDLVVRTRARARRR